MNMSSIIPRLTLCFTGPTVATRVKPCHFTTSRKYFSRLTSHGISSSRSHNASQLLLRQSTTSNLLSDTQVFTCCLLNRQNFSSTSPGLWGQRNCDKKISNNFDPNKNISFNGSHVKLNPLLVNDSPLVLQLRLLNTSQDCQEKGILIRKDGKRLSRAVKSLRESSQHTEGKSGNLPEGSSEEVEKLTLYQRFKKTYKEHGKILVAVHIATSIVWFGSFYTAASLGFDIVPLLESWNLSEKVISPFRSGGLGNIALAYLLYKLATPARYTVTIGGTNLAIRYLRKEGKMKVVPKEDTLRSLYKEGAANIRARSRGRIQRMRRNQRARRARRSGGDQTKPKS